MSYFPTIKGGVRFEKLRRASHVVMAELLDADPAVIRWTSVPVTICDGVSDEGFVTHFCAELRDGRRRAVKILRFTSDAAAIEAQRLELEADFRHLGVEVEILTEKALAKHPLRRVARTLFVVRSMEVPEGLLVEALAAGFAGNIGTLGELHDQLEEHGASWTNILTLVSRGHIEIAWGPELDRDTPLVGCSPEGWVS